MRFLWITQVNVRLISQIGLVLLAIAMVVRVVEMTPTWLRDLTGYVTTAPDSECAFVQIP